MLNFKKQVFIFCALGTACCIQANDEVVLSRDTDIKIEDIEVAEPPVLADVEQVDSKTVLEAQQEKNNKTAENMSEKELFALLKSNPEGTEQLMQQFIKSFNSARLKQVIPAYQTNPYHDPSLVDWGHAIIAHSEGDFDKAVPLYRKINAMFPNVKRLQFHLAVALYQDRQFDAAKNEFNKLRAAALDKMEQKAIDRYLEALAKKEEWSLSASLGYLSDENITNAPKVGTKLNDRWTYTSEHESGKGFQYSLGADKKWLLDDGYFLAFHLGSYGDIYVDNKKYNDVSIRAGVGFGYQDSKKEIEISPELSRRLFGGGSQADNEDLEDYTTTAGLKFSMSYWLNNGLRLQSLAKYSRTGYIDKYDKLDGDDFLLSNTLVWYPSQLTYIFGGSDLLAHNTQERSSSFDRRGVRVGWGQVWPYGMSSRLYMGYGQRTYRGPNFFNIKRKNNEYNVGLSVWNRAIHLYGLTPRLNYSYRTVTSNSSFEEYEKHNVSVEVTKTF